MIVGICGFPRKGKTALLTYFAIMSMCDTSNYYKSVERIERLNAGGYKFSRPPQPHVTYCNYDVFFKNYNYGERSAYKINPFYLGLPNVQHPTDLLAPYADIFITEGQRPLNSRMSYVLSDFVSQYYETGGHIGYDFYIDCQRLGLIDANVRELMELVIEVQDINFVQDRNGQIKKTIWHTVQFSSSFDYDLYLSSGRTKGGTSCKYVYPGDIRTCYNSFYCFPNYLRDAENKDFTYKSSCVVNDDVKSIAEFNANNPTIVPTTYYKKR